jgi:hypothetical protein
MTDTTVDDDSGFRFYNVRPDSTSNTSSTSSNQSSNGLGRRLKNPLGFYSSYNYQISLYLTTPVGMDLFRNTQKKDVSILTNSGNAFLVAQSGGINDQINNSAPGFEKLEYYIDDLVLKTATGAFNRSGSTNVTDIAFKIIEPYGFSFVTNLKRARNSFENNEILPRNPTRLPFLLGIGFLGYDENGNLMSGNKQYDSTTLDPENLDSNKLFTRYYFIEVTSVKFKIDGKATVYDITARAIDQSVAFNTKNGFINTAIDVTSDTVENSLQKLMNSLNEQEEKFVEDGVVEYPNVYSEVEYRNADKIKDAKIVNFPPPKYELPANEGSNSADSSVPYSQDGSALPLPNTNQKKYHVEKISVMQGITQLVRDSSYMKKQLRTVYNQELEPDSNGRETVSDTVDAFSWYTLSARISKGRWDNKRKDFVYTITYIIETYDTPVITHPQANPGIGYYGPHKRYEYWYTGKNSEILEYEQRLNNNYFILIYDTEDDARLLNGPGLNGPGLDSDIPRSVGQAASGDGTGSYGDSLRIQNAVYGTDLSDPSSFAQAKITIFGDPDFLMEDTIESPSQVYDQFYGANGFTISANGGQVFIEIDFNEATDYDYTNGTLSINNQIKFWNYPEEANIQGLSYQVIRVTSNFSNGTFKQVLECRMTYEFTNPIISSQENRSGPTPDGSATTNGLGLLKDIVPQFNTPSAATNTPIPYRLTEDN